MIPSAFFHVVIIFFAWYVKWPFKVHFVQCTSKTRRMPHVEQDILTLPEGFRSSPSFRWGSFCSVYDFLCCGLCKLLIQVNTFLCNIYFVNGDEIKIYFGISDFSNSKKKCKLVEICSFKKNNYSIRVLKKMFRNKVATI